MPGKPPRKKGDRAERELVNMLNNSASFRVARRVPLSGSMEFFSGDVMVDRLHKEWHPLPNTTPQRWEVKSRRTIPKWIRSYLEEAEICAIRCDGRGNKPAEWYVLMRLEDFLP